MSGQIGSQVRALPFTGFVILPLVLLGLALSGFGFLMTKLRSHKRAH